MKTKWTKEPPKEEGWYWIKYKVGRKYRICPGVVYREQDGTIMVRSGFNTTWTAGPRHGGPKLKCWDKNGKFKEDKTLHFGPKIPFPE